MFLKKKKIGDRFEFWEETKLLTYYTLPAHVLTPNLGSIAKMLIV